MIKGILFLFFLAQTAIVVAQTIDDSLSAEDAGKHITFLAADKLKGRVNFTQEQLEAAIYIANEFTAYGLSPYPEYTNFYHPVYSKQAGMLPPYQIFDTLSITNLYNVIGVLPGKGKPDEAIVFSAHYDHVDKDIMGRGGSVFNGANDNASGTTAVLMLARYFSLRKDNERTIIFCLFAGEELGLYGSRAFVRLVDPEKIIAVINIEMIGSRSRTGKNAFFVTGSSFSNLTRILKKNIEGRKVSIRKEGPDVARLFMRSDNYPFAQQGIPAHSIMCSDDKDPCYHKPCDDISGIDISNMTRVIQGIARACKTLLSGEDTPKRIKGIVHGERNIEIESTGRSYQVLRAERSSWSLPLSGIDSCSAVPVSFAPVPLR